MLSVSAPTLFSFTGDTNAGGPQAGLTPDGSTVFGVTRSGGTYDNGTVFSMNADGSDYQVLYSFGGTAIDAENPVASLTLVGSTLYGTTGEGGTYGEGTVFAIDTDGSNYRVLYNFGSATVGLEEFDGEQPAGGLTLVGSTLFGVTETGSDNNGGSIFSINTDGSDYQQRYAFREGAGPSSGLTLVGSTLFGTEEFDYPGGYGTVFSFNTGANPNTFQNLHSFSLTDGANPAGNLTLVGSTLFGTTYDGGSNSDGTVFSINTDGSDFQSLYSFGATGTDGFYPNAALTLVGSTLFGTTNGGGSAGNGDAALPGGTVFSVDTDGDNYQSLCSIALPFSDQNSPIDTVGSLTLVGSALLGTTSEGGTYGAGAVFSVPPVTITDVSTTDSQNLSITYSVNDNPDDTAFPIDVYRSTQSIADVGSQVLIASLNIEGDDAEEGSHTITVGAGSIYDFSQTQALRPDLTYKYVLATADETGVLDTADEIAPPSDSFRIWVVGLVTNGLTLSIPNVLVQLGTGVPGELFPNSMQAFVNQDAEALEADGYDEGIGFHWENTSDVTAPGQTQIAGQEIANFINQNVQNGDAEPDQVLEPNGNSVQTFGSIDPGPNDVVDVNFIGHSRGGVVVGLALSDLIGNEAPQLADGFQMETLLDPHPANVTLPGIFSNGAYGYSGASVLTPIVAGAVANFEWLAQDPNAMVPSDVQAAADFYQTTNASDFPTLNSENIVNLWGESPAQITNWPSFGLSYNLTGNGIGHSEVVSVYRSLVSNVSLTSLGLVPFGNDPLVVTTQPPPSVTAGSPFALTVTAENADGTVNRAFDGSISVAIANNPATGTLGGTLSVNAVNGVATFSNLTLSSAGSGYTLQVSSSGMTAVTTTPVNVLAPGVASRLVVTTEPPSSDKTGTPFGLVVKAEDGFGTVATSFNGTVTLALNNSVAGVLGGTLSVQAINGVATFSGLTVDEPGSYSISVSSGSLTPATTSGFVTTIAAANQLAVSAPVGNALLNTPFSLTVDADNPDGQTDPTFNGSVTVSLHNNSGGTLGGTLTATAVNGQATFTNLTLNAAGSGFTIQATAAGLIAGVSPTFAVDQDQLVVTTQPASTVAAGAGLGLAVAAENGAGKVDTSFNGNVTLIPYGGNSASGPTPTGNLTVAAVNGIATFSGLTFNQSGYYLFTAAGSNVVDAPTNVVDVTAKPASQLVVTAQPPTNVTSGAVFSLAISAEDALGNVDPTFNGNVTVSLANNSGGGVLGGTLTVQALNGVANFSNLSLTGSGTGFTIQATSNGETSTTTSPFSVTAAGIATQLVVQTEPPPSVGAGVAFGLVVDAEDGLGNVAANFNGTVTLALANNPGSGTLGGVLSTQAVNGVATFTGLTLDQSGENYSLSLTSSGLTAATTNAFDVAAGTAVKLVVEPPVDVLAGSPFSTLAVAEDSFGNVAANFNGAVTLALATNPGNGTLGGGLTVTAVQGVASFAGLTISAPGTGETLQASSLGFPGATSSPFNVTSDQLVITSQPPGGARTGTGFGLTVAADNGSGSVDTSFSGSVTAALVNFGTNATLGGTLTGTAVHGVISFSGLSINEPGIYELSLSAAGAGSVTTSPLDLVAGVSAPVVTPSGTTNTFTVGGTAVAVDSGVTVSFSGADLTGATMTISSATLQTGDTLNFTNQNGITGSYASGVLTLTGSATPAQYQTALQSVTFSTTSTSTTTRAISIVASDNSLSSTAAAESVKVVAATTSYIAVTGGGQPITIGSTTTSASNDTAFPSTVVGSSSSETYTITNTGTSGLSVGSLWVSGTNAGDFSIKTQPGTWVLAGQTTTFSVQFTPTATGTRSAVINFYENEGGSANTQFTFAVGGVANSTALAAPVVTTNPTTQSIAAGNPVTFITAASGNPTPTVQWQVSTNGGSTFTNITGATSTTYSFTTAATQTGYEYRAVFTNSQGTATTSAATLTVTAALAAPVVTTSPTSQSIVAGNTATFTAAASGNPTPPVQWQVSTNGGSTFTNIPGATSTTYSFTTAATQTGYEYRAVFTNSQGTATTSAATLTVTAALAAPVVTTSPTSQSIVAGNTATFTAAASGNPTPPVQWQVSTNGGSTFANITGATSTTYSFTTAATQTGYEYRAVFTNSQGTATTSAATLTVSYSTVTGNGQPIAIGATTTSGSNDTAFPSTVVGSSSSETYTITNTGTSGLSVGSLWVSGTNAGDFSIKTQPGTWVLAGQTTTFSVQFTPTATGTRSAVINFYENEGGSANTQFTFAVNGVATSTTLAAPVVTTAPTTQSIVAGSTVTFTAAASGNPTPTVQWQMSTNGGSTFTNITGTTSTTYSFTTATTQTGYKYQAVFTNSQGTATTSAATLTVTAALAAPVVTTNPTSQSIVAGSTVTFNSAASGNPTPTVQWQVSTNGGSTFTNISGATSTTYSFTTATTQTGYDYRAVFTNSQGTATTSAATLTVLYSTVTGNGEPIVIGSTTTSTTNDTAFASTAVGSSSSETYTITNTGTSGLSVGSLWVSGANAGDFSVKTQPGTWVLAGQTTTFTVQFTPTATGTRSAVINFYENEGGSANTQVTFAVSGVATAAAAAATSKASISPALALGVQETSTSQATTATTATAQTNVVSTVVPASSTSAAATKTSSAASVSAKASATAGTAPALQTAKTQATDAAVLHFDLADLYV